MDVRDGFILGIDNYCDRWCEHCAFTSRCRGFADCVQLEASQDPTLKAVADAPPLPQDIPPPPPPWMRELIDEVNKRAAEVMAEGTRERRRPTIAPEHEPIEARAHAYSNAVHTWLESRGAFSRYPSADPREVITWFQYSIPAKMHRAFSGLAADDLEDRDWPADHDGSAKVALLGIERSHAAWLELVHKGLATPSEIEPFVADLIWLSDELERVFPRARSFVRPGFDEPDAVARLLAMEGGGA